MENTSILQYFIDKKLSLDIADKDGNNLCFYAAKGENIKTIKFRNQKGAAYGAVNNKGENAVLFASQGMKRKALRLDVFKYLSEELHLEVDQVS